MQKQEPFHFFASSIATWATTTKHRSLRDLLELMESEPYRYSLWKVPGDDDANYSIEHYAPKVEGAVWLGAFDVQEKKK